MERVFIFGHHMKYALVNIHSKEFEKLVVGICQKLLGITVQQFSDGPDGGRDARFEGEADQLKKTGKFVIQAKHTTNPIAKFTDMDFSENKSSTMLQELPKVTKLITDEELDYYLLFSNRRMSADAESKVRQLIMTTGLDSSAIHLFGLESIEGYLDQYPDLPKLYNVDFYHTPIQVTPNELADVISAFHKNKPSEIDETLNPEPVGFHRPGIEIKNQINGLTDEYFNYIKEVSFSTFAEIAGFLESPINDVYREYYDTTVADLRATLIAHKNDYDTFDSILENFYKHLIERDNDLKKHRKLTRAFLHYMYWKCDIGEKENAET